MKVYILSPFESKMAKRGTRHPRLAEFLAAGGFAVEYVTGNFSHARKEFFPQEEVRHWQSILPYKLTVLKIPGYYDHLSIRRVIVHCTVALKMFMHLLARLTRGDVIVIPSRPPELIFAVSLLKMVFDIRVLVDIRDVWPDSLPTQSRLKYTVFAAYCNLLLYPSLYRIDRFVHTAPSFLPWLNRYAPSKSSTFIPLGYDRQRWEKAHKLPELSNGSRIELVYVGAVTRQIDLSGVMQAIAGDERYHLTIIGDGETLDALKQDATGLSMPNITFTGFIPYEQVVAQMQHMHIGIIPMTGSHAMPNKFFDYIASRRPILVLGENDASRFVEKHQIGWGCSFNADEIRTFFRNLSIQIINEKNVRVDRIRDSFSKESLYRDYIDIISGNR